MDLCELILLLPNGSSIKPPHTYINYLIAFYFLILVHGLIIKFLFIYLIILQLVKLPRNPNVDDILNKYLAYRSKMDGM